MNEPIKRGRGRPSGAVSFSNMTLEELNARFHKSQLIPVSRVFLDNSGKFVTSKQTEQINNVASATPTPIPSDSKIEMSLSE
jgi:hypothetical protein